MNQNFKKVYLYSIQLLAKRDYSKFKILAKFSNKFPEFEQDIFNNVIDHIVEKKYLNEDNYTVLRIRSLSYKKYGLSYIKKKLEQEKIFLTNDQINNILSEELINLNNILSKNVKRYIEKKKIDLKNFKSKNKVFYYFFQKGHQFDDILFAINSLKL